MVMRGTTAAPDQLPAGTLLDGRVFTLSPDGAFLLYTRANPDTSQFHNTLWLIATDGDAQPRSLEVENVLWAGWDPTPADNRRIAFTTATPAAQPPGWEAANDLWLGVIAEDAAQPFVPQRVIESYPASYGWWGGNYAWSPDGRMLAYSYANEVGIIPVAAEVAATQAELMAHQPLYQFTEYRTGSDWVWVPPLSWSPGSQYLSFAAHVGEDPDAAAFELRIASMENGTTGVLRPQAGMWAATAWSPAAAPGGEQIAFLQADDTADSQRSSYRLWLMDQDGSNARPVYPPPDENSFFARESTALAWSPDGQTLAFIFHDALYLLTLADVQAVRITQDESRNSHLTWPPIGRRE
jgi:hypothetical protein